MYGSSFNSVHGTNAAEFLTDFSSKRFIMDGENPEGAKVGLLDARSVWCFMVNPFKEKLKFNIEIKGGVAQARNHMIKKLVNGDTETFATNCRSIMLQLNQYCTRQGVWKYVFELDRFELSLDNVGEQEELRLSHVSEWIKETGCLESRLSYIGGAGMNRGQLYETILKPLLSMGTSGSVSVERIAKPMKNYILNKHRNKLGLMRAHMCLRVGLNLRFLAKARGELKSDLDLEDLEVEASQEEDDCSI